MGFGTHRLLLPEKFDTFAEHNQPVLAFARDLGQNAVCSHGRHQGIGRVRRRPNNRSHLVHVDNWPYITARAFS